MRRTSWRTLVVVALVVGVLAALLTTWLDRQGPGMPRVSWLVAAVEVLIAAVVFSMGWAVRQFLRGKRPGLDPIRADVINDLIIQSVKGLGATALSITHDMASARKIADHVAMIYQGKIIWAGEAKDIDNSGNPYVEQFVKGKAEGPIRMPVRSF